MADRSHLIKSADFTLEEDIRVRRITVSSNSSGAGKVTVYPNGSESASDVFDLLCIQDQSSQFVFDDLLLPLGAFFDLSTNCAYVILEYRPNDERPGEG